MPSPAPSPPRPWSIRAAALVLAAAAALVYRNSFSVPFVFDDLLSIRDNPTIRRLWPLWRALAPPDHGGLTVQGRPVLNLSLAINYAISGERVWSYHAFNLAVHVLAGLALLGIVRRTLEGMGERAPGAGRGLPYPSLAIAFAVSLLWLVHPLQTEAVTYLVQRAESLMGLFYLLTLYCFIRFVPARPGAPSALWAALGVLCCLLGMGTKEVMVSAPVVVFLYDRTFLAGAFGAAWRLRRKLHLALAATWIPLAALVALSGNRGGTAGGDIGVGPLRYWATQFQAVAHYLRLAAWPHPLIFDYGAIWARGPGQVVPYALAVGALAAATAWALRRRPAAGFLGFWFFAILAPTSVVPGMRQTLAEHRMYLALVPVLVFAVSCGYARFGRWVLGAALVLAVAWGCLAARRNEVYRSQLALFRDTVAKRPDNAFARYNLGKILDEAGQPEAAIPQYLEAIRLRPGLVDSYYNLGNALTELGRLPAAADEYQAALALEPGMAEAHYNLGNVLVRLGRKEDALGQYREAVRLKPDYIDAQDNLGSVLFDLGRLPAALAQYRKVLALDPSLAEGHYNLGSVYRVLGRRTEAVREYRAALRLDPDFAPAQAGLAALGAAPGP
jgi:protein O-mannosyl-transferase